jgi:hypothetical protein
MPTFTISTELDVTPEAFWEHMSMAAVNAELSPLVRMTAPPEWQRCPLAQWTAGRVLFRSVILLFGFLPVDVHSLRFEHLMPEGGFVERSHSWANRLWQHERTTARTPGGCVVTDRLTVQGRLPLLAALLLPVYRLVFRHRHRRLTALYGAVRHDKICQINNSKSPPSA